MAPTERRLNTGWAEDPSGSPTHASIWTLIGRRFGTSIVAAPSALMNSAPAGSAAQPSGLVELVTVTVTSLIASPGTGRHEPEADPEISNSMAEPDLVIEPPIEEPPMVSPSTGVHDPLVAA